MSVLHRKVAFIRYKKKYPRRRPDHKSSLNAFQAQPSSPQQSRRHSQETDQMQRQQQPLQQQQQPHHRIPVGHSNRLPVLSEGEPGEDEPLIPPPRTSSKEQQQRIQIFSQHGQSRSVTGT